MAIPDYLSSGEPARLMPVAADSSKEVRAVSILLATMMSVPAFARAMFASIGQRVGARASLDAYTETVFRDGDAARIRPDGLVELDGGRGRIWKCLVEAKIGRADLDSNQICTYLALAKTHKIDAVLTISNQFATIPTHSPVNVPKSALRGVELFHWSWMFVLTQARLLLSDDEFDRPEQRYILAEMARYFSHPSVGVSTFDRMNPEWKDLVAQVQTGAQLNKASAAVENTVAAWHQETRDLCLLLTRQVRRPVRIRLSRAHADDPGLRLRDDSALLADQHCVFCDLEVPDAASAIKVVADVQRRSVTVCMTLSAPKDKQRTSSRVNWLLRQVAKADPDSLHVRAAWPGRAPDTQATLKALRDDPSRIDAGNQALVPTQFSVLLIKDLAGKFSGTKTFIEQLEEAVPKFYEQVGQYLRAYVEPPPRVQKVSRELPGEEPLQVIAGEAAAAASEAVDETPTNPSPE
jgi:hypothetical protein